MNSMNIMNNISLFYRHTENYQIYMVETIKSSEKIPNGVFSKLIAIKPTNKKIHPLQKATTREIIALKLRAKLTKQIK